jgi:signal transduction histidine kinase
MRGDRPTPPGPATVPRIVGGVAAAGMVALGTELVVFGGADPTRLPAEGPVLSWLASLPCLAGLASAGYWLRRRDLAGTRGLRIAAWLLAGVVVALGLSGPLAAVRGPGSAWSTVGWLRTAATAGAAVGVLAGIVEARAIQQALSAERSRLHSEQLEARREWLDYLNGLLRHEVLNTAQVVDGYAETVLHETDPGSETRARLAAIQRQSQDMTEIIEDVRVLLDATRGEVTFERVDLVALVRDEVRDLRDVCDAVEVDTDLPEPVYVRADALLPRVFSNLLGNAVEHNDSEHPRVEVRVQPAPETVLVTIADDGPGIPPTERDRLFERDTPTRNDHGLGLYLVRQLVDRYEGRVELAETGPAGTTFVVELPRAPAPTGATRGRVDTVEEVLGTEDGGRPGFDPERGATSASTGDRAGH